MKKFILFPLLLLTAVCNLIAAPAGANSDPEYFAGNGIKRDFTGVYPARVKTIAVITPGSYPTPKSIKQGVALLRKAGYKVKVYPNALRPRPKNEKNYYASMAVEYRVRDFEAAWNDMENDMIICTRGGVGTEKLVAAINWDKLPRRPELYFQGYSDVTMMLCALSAKGYGRPVAGPTISSHSGLAPEILPDMKKMFHGETVGPFMLKTFVPGDCSGKPVAGLLSRFVRVCRAGYKLDVKGKILFIESVRCTPETVRKDLQELLERNFFDGAAGVVFCHFTRGAKLSEIEPVLKKFAPEFKVPVYMGYPFGHHPRNLVVDYSRQVVISGGKLTFPAVK